MASDKTSIIVGRFVFFALIVLQCIFLASYPAYYEDEGAWYAVTLLLAPAAMMWFWIISVDAKFEHIFSFWIVYIWLGVVPLIGIVFGRIGDKIESEGFWNANTLKMTLYITPLLHFLIFRTEIATTDLNVHDTKSGEEYVKEMLNLFDGIELVAVILDENECSHGIPGDFKNTLLSFTCIGFLWWSIAAVMFESDAACGDDSTAVVYMICFPVQVLFDTIFLGLRLGLCLGYGKNVSIFINKNIAIITVFSWRIVNFCCGKNNSNNSSTANRQQGESTEPSTPATSVVPANAARVGNRRVSSSAVAPLPTAPPPPYEAFPQPPPYSVGIPP